jgi:uncharacterized protein (TIGR03435 family)
VGASGTYNANLGQARHGTVTLTNCTLADCLRFAYSFASNEQISGPDWIKDKNVRFDILAKAPADSPVDALLSMLQKLLADRFQLTLHHAPKDMEHYALTIAKNGPKLHAVDFDINELGTTAYGRGRLAHNQATMTVFTTLLSRLLDLPVIDQTGLKGFYPISLEWAPDPLPNERAADQPAGQSIFTAVQDQLGLKLTRDKGPVDSIMVDHALKTPIAN